MRRLAAGMIATLALAVVGTAQATTWCVTPPGGSAHPDCPAGVTPIPSLQEALERNAGSPATGATDAGTGSDGAADTVLVGAGTVTANTTDESLTGTGGFQAKRTDEITIVGAGESQTTLARAHTVGADNTAVLYVPQGAVVRTVRDLRVVVGEDWDDNVGLGIALYKGTLERVRVQSTNPGSDGVAAYLGLTLRASTVDVDGSAAYGVTDGGPNAGAVLVEDATINGTNGARALSIDEPGSVTVRRSTLAASLPIYARDLDVTLQSSLILMRNEGVSVTAAINVGATGAGNLALAADGLTLVREATNPATATGFLMAAAGAGNATGTVVNSIIRGFTTAGESTSASTGVGSLSIDYANVDGTVGAGATAGAYVGSADPLFVDAPGGDYRLQLDSPLMDAGDPAQGGPTQDRDGAARVLDGDGDGTAVRDIGAFERNARFALSVQRSGDGTGTVTGTGIACGTDCAEIFGDGAAVTLTAAPDGGSTFSGWSGACTGTGACQVTMDQVHAVTATFTKPAPAPAPTTQATTPPAGTTTPPVTSGVQPAKRCTVPRLKGLTLAQARRALKRAGCTGAIVVRRQARRKGHTLVKVRVASASVTRGSRITATRRIVLRLKGTYRRTAR